MKKNKYVSGVDTLKIGESTVFTYEDRKKYDHILSAVHFHGGKSRKKFITRTVEQGKIKVWRIKINQDASDVSYIPAPIKGRPSHFTTVKPVEDKLVPKKEDVNPYSVLAVMSAIIGNQNALKEAKRANPLMSHKKSVAKEAYDYVRAMMEVI